MPRLRDTRTGVVVDVDDDTAAAIGAAYEPVKQDKDPARKSTAKKAASSTTEK